MVLRLVHQRFFVGRFENRDDKFSRTLDVGAYNVIDTRIHSKERQGKNHGGGCGKGPTPRAPHYRPSPSPQFPGTGKPLSYEPIATLMVTYYRYGLHLLSALHQNLNSMLLLIQRRGTLTGEISTSMLQKWCSELNPVRRQSHSRRKLRIL